jgi:hypothetical protein
MVHDIDTFGPPHTVFTSHDCVGNAQMVHNIDTFGPPHTVFTNHDCVESAKWCTTSILLGLPTQCLPVMTVWRVPKWCTASILLGLPTHCLPVMTVWRMPKWCTTSILWNHTSILLNWGTPPKTLCGMHSKFECIPHSHDWSTLCGERLNVGPRTTYGQKTCRGARFWPSPHSVDQS